MDKYLEQISDGKLYELNDMAKVGCHNCEGCHDCCTGMGDTILLDPYDVYRLSRGLGKTVEELMQGHIELHMEEGLILPNLKMTESTKECTFLNKEGRCSIHEYRPGICRLFPLGRNYEKEHVNYFILKDDSVLPCENDMVKEALRIAEASTSKGKASKNLLSRLIPALIGAAAASFLFGIILLFVAL